MILVDILVAMSLATLFVALFSARIFSTEQSFVRAHERMVILMASSSSMINLFSLNLTSPIFIPVSSSPACSTDFIQGFISPIITEIPLPISSTMPLTHLEVRDGIAFVSTDSNITSDPDLFVINISNSSIISSINTGPGISSFVLIGKKIFAAAASTAAQLHVIDFSGTTSPSIPFLSKKYQLPLPYATATPPYATAISFGFNGNYGGDWVSGDTNFSPPTSPQIYLGTERWDGDELAVIDVSNPEVPVWQSGLDIGSKVNDIEVDTSTSSLGGVYISNASQNQLIRADLGSIVATLELNITEKFSPTGWSRQEGKVSSILGGNLVFGRTSGGYDIATDHELFSWASTPPINPLISDVLNGPYNSKNIPGGVYGIIQDAKHIYLITRQAGKEFQVFDKTLATSSYFSLATQPQSVTCDGEIIYVLSHTSPIIYAISFTK